MVNIATALKDLSLKALTPPNIQADETVQGLIYALDPELQSISTEAHSPSVLSRIDEMDEQELDLLAWQFHADFYDLAGTLRLKREVVKNAIKLHMKKGTVWAIREALRQLDIEAEYVPWWESGGEPYTFSLRAIVGGEFYRTSGKDALIRNIHRAVNEAKSARSLLVSLHTEIREEQELQLYACTIPFVSGEIYIYPEKPSVPESTFLYTGIAGIIDGHETIGLERCSEIDGKAYAGVIMVQETGYEIGVDLDTMQELLLRFEDRIFARIDDQERRISQGLELMAGDIVKRLEHIEKLLQWSGDDEEL